MQGGPGRRRNIYVDPERFREIHLNLGAGMYKEVQEELGLG